MIEIKIKPMSMGRAWSQTKSGRRFLTKEASDYKKIIALSCSKLSFLSGYTGAIGCKAEFHGPWLTKKGQISRTAGDVDNFTKLIFDAIGERYGFDDSQIMEVSLKKVISDKWKILISLKAISL
jgi:Holliday junction resolvase RusA-like endonuclease